MFAEIDWYNLKYVAMIALSSAKDSMSPTIPTTILSTKMETFVCTKEDSFLTK